MLLDLIYLLILIFIIKLFGFGFYFFLEKKGVKNESKIDS